jgi:NAD(P)-dependent dehydrogenase (short-subunit alcohol dehydrogenase family)
MSGRMSGRKAVVVGAGQPKSDLLGNGRAIALTLAREGAEVCAVDLHRDRAEATAELIEQAGGKAHVIVADVGKADDCVRLIEESYAAMGRIDALVNNVAINHVDSDPLNLTLDGWQQMFDVNLRSQWIASKTVVPLMRKHGGGAITNISTIGSKTAGGRMFAYSMSKAGVNKLTHFFAAAYAEDNIRCNAVLPAFVLTPHSVEGLTRHGWTPSREELEKTGAQSVPMGRLGSAQDVANAVLFLSCDESAFITGLEVPVDGGTLAIVGRYSKPAPAKT